MSIVLETTKGSLTFDLYTEHRPKVCQNFLKLCQVKYYNFQLFHSIQRDFLAQSGDPQGTGRGGESIFGRLYGGQARFFEGDPLLPKIKHSKPGLLSMVNTGSNLYGSQFFITLGSDLTYLDEQQHCVFGEVTEGSEFLETLSETITDKEGRPYQDIRISHTVILDDPFEHPPNLKPLSRSPSPDPEYLKTDRLAADEDFEEYEGKTAEELVEITAEKEAKARATILEMIGDLPDVDVAPPENVLFVCKLNPVTTDEDLEIIFARFGKVVSCEVIRDSKTGDSLQYAFIEFDSPEACEKAYFKMDNVLIDDRRIHVDFSQSVSKYRWKGKGRLEIRKEEEEGGDKAESRRRDHRKDVKRGQFNHSNREAKRSDDQGDDRTHHNRYKEDRRESKKRDYKRADEERNYEDRRHDRNKHKDFRRESSVEDRHRNKDWHRNRRDRSLDRGDKGKRRHKDEKRSESRRDRSSVERNEGARDRHRDDRRDKQKDSRRDRSSDVDESRDRRHKRKDHRTEEDLKKIASRRSDEEDSKRRRDKSMDSSEEQRIRSRREIDKRRKRRNEEEEERSSPEPSRKSQKSRKKKSKKSSKRRSSSSSESSD